MALHPLTYVLDICSWRLRRWRVARALLVAVAVWVTEGGPDTLAFPALPVDLSGGLVDLPLPTVSEKPLAVPGRAAVLIGGITDPGVPGRQNQDDFFMWASADGRSCALGVFDGHGRELGQQAAAAATNYFRGKLASEEGIAAIRANPEKTLRDAFQGAHDAVAEVICFGWGSHSCRPLGRWSVCVSTTDDGGWWATPTSRCSGTWHCS